MTRMAPGGFSHFPWQTVAAASGGCISLSAALVPCVVVVSCGDARHLAALAQGAALKYINCSIALILNA